MLGSIGQALRMASASAHGEDDKRAAQEKLREERVAALAMAMPAWDDGEMSRRVRDAIDRRPEGYEGLRDIARALSELINLEDEEGSGGQATEEALKRFFNDLLSFDEHALPNAALQSVMEAVCSSHELNEGLSREDLADLSLQMAETYHRHRMQNLGKAMKGWSGEELRNQVWNAVDRRPEGYDRLCDMAAAICELSSGEPETVPWSLIEAFIDALDAYEDEFLPELEKKSILQILAFSEAIPGGEAHEEEDTPRVSVHAADRKVDWTVGSRWADFDPNDGAESKSALEPVPAPARAHRQEWLDKVRQDADALWEVPDDLLGDEAIVLAAVTVNGLLLEAVPWEKQTFKMAMAAVRQHGSAIEFVNRDLRRHWQIGLAACASGAHPEQPPPLRYLPESLRRNVTVVRQAVARHGLSLKYAQSLAEDEELGYGVCLLACWAECQSVDESTLPWVPWKWRNALMCWAAMCRDPQAIDAVPKRVIKEILGYQDRSACPPGAGPLRQWEPVQIGAELGVAGRPDEHGFVEVRLTNGRRTSVSQGLVRWLAWPSPDQDGKAQRDGKRHDKADEPRPGAATGAGPS